jgi:hypothetical protein
MLPTSLDDGAWSYPRYPCPSVVLGHHVSSCPVTTSTPNDSQQGLRGGLCVWELAAFSDGSGRDECSFPLLCSTFYNIICARSLRHTQTPVSKSFIVRILQLRDAAPQHVYGLFQALATVCSELKATSSLGLPRPIFRSLSWRARL